MTDICDSPELKSRLVKPLDSAISEFAETALPNHRIRAHDKHNNLLKHEFMCDIYFSWLILNTKLKDFSQSYNDTESAFIIIVLFYLNIVPNTHLSE